MSESASGPLLYASNVHKRFGRHEVLRGVDLEVERGEVAVIIGASGSGKSTFLRCINHLEEVNAGRLYVDGVLIGYREKKRGDKLRSRQAATRYRHGVPALQPVPAPDGAGEHHRGADPRPW